MSSLNYKRKVPKAIVKRMIESGRYQVVVQGTTVTDWKKLFDEAPQDDSVDVDLPIIPITDIVLTPSPETPQPPTEPAHTFIDGKKYTIRQLEHFGDAVVALAVRTMVYNKCGGEARTYFHYTQKLITNKNLGHGNVRDGSAAEVKIGTAWAEIGLDAALECATEILSNTEAWKAFVNFIGAKK